MCAQNPFEAVEPVPLNHKRSLALPLVLLSLALFQKCPQLSCPLYMRLVVSLREMKQGSKSRFLKNGKRPVIGPPP